MLTQNEKNWLEEREKRPAPCILNESWNWCLNICSGQTLPLRSPCPMVPDYRDAAEFEARVAAKLAIARMEVNWDDDFSCCPPETGERECSKKRLDCQWCWLKNARLAVESEMEAENGPVF